MLRNGASQRSHLEFLLDDEDDDAGEGMAAHHRAVPRQARNDLFAGFEEEATI
jgi:hypothetical protein